MVDYYSTLLRAVTAPEAGDAKWRREIYDRARFMLASRLRELRPQPSLAETASEEAALEAAIERIESEMAWTDVHAGGAAPRDADDSFVAADEIEGDLPERPLPDETSGFGTWTLIAAAFVLAALGAGGYVYWSAHRTPPNAAQSVAAAPNGTVDKNGELPPGVDGGSTDADLPYVMRRQPTFYRTLQPVGTVIVDKLQHFLYLVQPNNVALRYGIALGAECADSAGLRHVASMAEWPPWQPPPDLLKRNPNAMPGGPGNPLGARLIALDDNSSRIHGTNAPKTIGNTVAFGCFRLVNDDIIDLYGRVKVSTPVVVN
jgi:lipoprotein-anchoring transpeptidase ErfK/SrfK